MLNREKYAKEILDIACSVEAIALWRGKICSCDDIRCDMCDFYSSDCNERIKEWANSEYAEPPVDWSMVPVDTPILVRSAEEHAWIHRYFAKYENGSVYAWTDGRTSWSDGKNMTMWGRAKLAESEESHD